MSLLIGCDLDGRVRLSQDGQDRAFFYATDIPDLIRQLRTAYLKMTTDDIEDAKEHEADDVTDLLTEADYDIQRRRR